VSESSGGGAVTGNETARPVLRLVRGEPTPEELAALVAVLAARGGGEPEPEPEPRSLWQDRAALMRAPLTPGPGSWRASGLPR
jgi:hypothetical protein